MAVKLNISCGCGFKTHLLSQGELHTQRTGHTISVLGSITPDKLDPKAKITDVTKFSMSRLDELSVKLRK